MWVKQYFWNLPGRFLLLYLYHLLWAGAWRAGKTGRVWARLRTEVYRNKQFKLYEMRQNGEAYSPIPTGNGPPHPSAIQGTAPTPKLDRATSDANIASAQAAIREDAIQHHELLARGWEERYNSGGFKRRAEYFQEQMLPHLDVSGKWLDAGCGSGNFSRVLVEHGASVTGVDAADGMIEAANILSKDHPDRERLSFAWVGTVEALPDADETYDGVLCLSVLEYLPDPVAAMQEFARVLKPGGQVAVSLANRRSPLRMAGWLKARLSSESKANASFINHSKFALSRPEVSQFFESNGFEITKLGGFNPILRAELGARAPSLFFVTAVKR